MNNKLQLKHVKIIVLSLAAILLSWFILHTILVTLGGLIDNVQQADVAIVLGNEVNPDGTPSNRLKARLDKAVELYQSHQTENFIVSGGTGTEGFDEAQVMKQYLVAQNIPEANIITDSQGINTDATAKNSAIIMQQKNWKSAIVVTQYFHIARTKLALRKANVSPIYSAHANYFELRDIYSSFREFFAYYAYL